MRKPSGRCNREAIDGHDFRLRRADRDAEAGRVMHGLLQPAKRRGEIGIEPLGAGEIEIEIVERGGFDRRGERLQHRADARGEIGVVFVLARHDDGRGAHAARLAETHRRAHAAHLGFVTRRCHHAAAHQHRPPAQTRVQHLLDRSEKCVHIGVDDMCEPTAARHRFLPNCGGREPGGEKRVRRARRRRTREHAAVAPSRESLTDNEPEAAAAPVSLPLRV